MKKNIVIWANCQGTAISLMLNKYFSNEFTVHLFVNYVCIENNIKLPEIMYKCDVFLYQNYSNNKGEYNLEHIINNVLPSDVIKVSFPTLHRNNLQFPFEYDSVENINTCGKKFPHGEFYYGIINVKNYVLQLKLENLTNDEIKKKTLLKIDDVDFLNIKDMKIHEEKSLNFLKNKAETSDIPNIYNFVLNNYKKIRLFHNPNHPNGILLNELCKEIFYKLNLHYPSENENIQILDGCLRDWKMPIFNSVMNYYKIDNIDNECCSMYHDDIFDKYSYINKYVDFLLKTM